jgi:hypothetical protein
VSNPATSPGLPLGGGEESRLAGRRGVQHGRHRTSLALLTADNTGSRLPAASVVGCMFGTWTAARRAAFGEDVDARTTGDPEPVTPIRHANDLCAQSPGIARKIGRSEEVRVRA